MRITISRRQFGIGSFSLWSAMLAGAPLGAATKAKYKTLVPGTGRRVARTGDDFEEEDFSYWPGGEKSSWNLDDNIRVPGGLSKNRKWVEAAKRGQPDLVKRIKTPPDGPPDSKGSLLIQTLNPGIPGVHTEKVQQDDLLHNTEALIGGYLPVSYSPSCTVRVYIPVASQWEKRLGSSFGFRTGLLCIKPDGVHDECWPGIFFEMQAEQKKGGEKRYFIRSVIRADEHGRDLIGPSFEPGSWVTLGMSVSPDGYSHFYARKGVEDLTEADHISSYICYNWKPHTFQTFFFNVMTLDDGKTWSTPWVIDDAGLFVATPPAHLAKKEGRTVK